MKEDVLAYFETRFGLQRSLFSDFIFFSGEGGRIYLGPRSFPDLKETLHVGLPAARVGRSIKPSSHLVQLFGRHATKNVVQLTRYEAAAYMQGDDLPAKGDATDGHVILMHDGVPLGCGLLRDGVIKNRLPKAKRLALKYF